MKSTSSGQIPWSIFPVQIARIENNALVLEGLAIIETLTSSEMFTGCPGGARYDTYSKSAAQTTSDNLPWYLNFSPS